MNSFADTVRSNYSQICRLQQKHFGAKIAPDCVSASDVALPASWLINARSDSSGRGVFDFGFGLSVTLRAGTSPRTMSELRSLLDDTPLSALVQQGQQIVVLEHNMTIGDGLRVRMVIELHRFCFSQIPAKVSNGSATWSTMV